MPSLYLYKLGHFFYRIRLRPIARIFSYINRVLFSVWLPSSVTIGKNFTIAYWGLGIVIHDRTIIGNNVTVGQNVTIGRNLGDDKIPVIGNDVYIGAGSVIFGGVNIGDNVIIGSNSVINKSINANTTVVGNPFRVIEKNRVPKYYELDIDSKTSYWDFWFK